jgi:hypothetical protein
MAVAVKEKLEDLLLEDRAALVSEDVEAQRKVSLRRRAVEEATRVTRRLQVALTEGMDWTLRPGCCSHSSRRWRGFQRRK